MLTFSTRHPETGALLEVEAEHYPGRRGSRDSYGAPEEPDEPETLEIESVYQDGQEIDFKDIKDALETALIKTSL